MGRVELEIIQEKLIALEGYYRELEELKTITFEDYCNNNLYKRRSEKCNCS